MNKKLLIAACLCGIASSAMAESTATRVTVQNLADLAIYPSIEIPASAVSMNDSKISSEVKATVKNIPVLVGDTVKRGKILVELNDRDFKLALKRAKVGLKGIESRLKLAKYQQTQAQTLYKQKAITDELLQQRDAEVEILISELESQKVAVEIAQRDIEKCLVTAPFDATITERLAQVGELANTGTPLVRVSDVSRIEVSAKIQPQDIKSLSNDNEYTFISQNIAYPITLRKLTPVVDLVQRNQEARFKFKKERALPGTSGVLFWKQKLPYIPSNYVLRRNKQYGVFIIKNSKAHFFVLAGLREGKPSPVNLPMNTKIIVDGRFTLQNGDVITIDKKPAGN